MAGKFTETTETGWGTGIVNSIKGVLFGLVLFLASFVVLWTNEGRQDMAQAGKECQPITADVIEQGAEGKPVTVSAKIVSSELLGDKGYLIPGNYITLTRRVEMYAWVEHSSSKSEKKLGGKTVTETTYSYSKEWTSSPQNSSRFKVQEDNFNPTLTIKGESYKIQSAKIGAYDLNLASLSLPGEDQLPLTDEITDFGDSYTSTDSTLGTSGTSFSVTSRSGFAVSDPDADRIIDDTRVVSSSEPRLEGGFIYTGNGNPQSPQVGDIRISYTALASDTYMTIFGKLTGSKIIPFMYKDEHKLYRAFRGEREEAIAQMHTEFKTVGWLMRILGFVMMWIGLSMFLGPINAVLDVVPFLGKVGRGIVSFVMFFIALILSGITIIIAMIFHNIIALILTILVVGGLIGFQIMRKKAAAAA